MTTSDDNETSSSQSAKRSRFTPIRLNLIVIAALIALLNAGIMYLAYVAITQEDVSEFIVGALIGLLPVGITGLVGLGTTLLNENRDR